MILWSIIQLVALAIFAFWFIHGYKNEGRRD